MSTQDRKAPITPAERMRRYRRRRREREEYVRIQLHVTEIDTLIRMNGVYRERVNLSSGRFAMIDDGLGFSLVPWSPSLERHLGRTFLGLQRRAELNGTLNGDAA